MGGPWPAASCNRRPFCVADLAMLLGAWKNGDLPGFT